MGNHLKVWSFSLGRWRLTIRKYPSRAWMRAESDRIAKDSVSILDAFRQGYRTGKKGP